MSAKRLPKSPERSLSVPGPRHAVHADSEEDKPEKSAVFDEATSFRQMSGDQNRCYDRI